MTMRHCWVRNIRVHSPKLLILAALLAGAQPDPLADLKSGAAALDGKRYSAAIATLAPLPKRLPKLADYAAWFLASAQFESQDYAAVEKSLQPVWKQSPPSPLAARAVILSAGAYEQSDRAKDAVEILRKHYASLPQPQGDLAMANAFEAAGDRVSAAVYFQRVYFGYPAAAEAVQADSEISRLREQLGSQYPPAMPDAMLGRAFKLLNAGHSVSAKKELESILPDLGGAERDLARVRIGVADYNEKKTLEAQKYLESLKLDSPDADAERLSYLVLCSRRLKNHEQVHANLDTLARLYPQSKWRLQALITDASLHLVDNSPAEYEPQYRACYESFPQEPEAAMCHWKVVWGHYLRRQSDSADLLRAHLRMFPASEDTSAALYFLGRLAEGSGDGPSARAYYDEITREYPNYYYTVLARERLKSVTAAPSPAVNQFLRAITFPQRSRKLDFQPNATAQARIERSRLLMLAGLDDWAQGELKFGAQTEDQPHVLGMELAKLSAQHGGVDQAMRYIKHYAGGYLMMPLDSAPAEFWKLAFPLPYRADLERFSKQNGLDPFLVAALIRQESEFNPKAVSPANARGLTQILPSTGRELSRKLKVRPYSTARLFQPAVSLQFGSYYLKTITDSLGGHFEAALAAYNAGLSRAHSWLSWGDFHEPAEFVETVPFSETRNYIETVMRNADVYRRLYGGSAGTSRAALK